MASTFIKSLVLFLALNFLFITLASACGECGTGGQKPKPKPTPTPYPGTPGGGSSSSPSSGGGSSSGGKCPKNALKLGVCANVLNLLKLKIGKPPKEPCCPLVQGLIDAEAAVCLCTSIKAGVLGIINLDIPVDLTLLVNYCGRKLPEGFKCS